MKAFLRNTTRHFLEEICDFLARGKPSFDPDWDKQFIRNYFSENDLKIKCDELFRYFLTGINTYVSKEGSLIYYPGFPSYNGKKVGGLEGFARTLPLLSAWLSSARSPKIRLYNNSELDIPEFIRRGFYAGVRPGPGFWGECNDLDQRLVEAHDIAISYYMIRERFPSLFDAETNQLVCRWLNRAAQRKYYDNNWLLFSCVIEAVLLKLEQGGSKQQLSDHFNRVKDFYLKCGWFTDGPKGKVDYYNVWGFQYSLFWLDRIMPSFETDFIINARQTFINTYQYMISPIGAPLFGRSLIYRLAVSAPFLMAAHHDSKWIGLSQRAFRTTWDHYLNLGSLSRGKITQGIFLDNPSILDTYSCPASPLWGLRSLILVLLFIPQHLFWKTSEQALPVEKNDYKFEIAELGWKIEGNRDSNKVCVHMTNGKNAADSVYHSQTAYQRFSELLTGLANRPENYEVKYDLEKYESGYKFQSAIFNNAYAHISETVNISCSPLAD